MRAALSLLVLALILGCGGFGFEAPTQEKKETHAQKAAKRKSGKKKAKKSGKQAQKGDAFDVPGINQARQAHIGKVVTVRGYLLGTTSQGKPPTQLNVAVGASGNIDAESVLCVAAPDDKQFQGVRQYSAVTVRGKVAEKDFFDEAMLEGCTRVE